MSKQNINEFSLLTKENKIIKLTSMLVVFSESKNIFSDLYKLVIEFGSRIEDGLLIVIYNLLFDAINNITDEGILKSINDIDEIKSKFEELRKKELEEKKKDEEEGEHLIEQI